MEHEQPGHEQLGEAMESCRPGSDDAWDLALAPLADLLALDPELADRFQRQQRADEAVAAAVGDVPLPDGLAQRLLERLALARAEASAGVRPSAAGSVPRRRPHWRRWSVVAAAALAAAAVLLAAVWIESHSAAAYTPLAVLEQATEFFNAESPRAGSRPAEVAPPARYPISGEVLRTPQVRWRPIRGLLDCPGVAYDLSPPGGPLATLYVVSRAVADLRPQPPLEPRPTTAGCSAGAWQEGGLLYVLVVKGGPGVYRSYLRLPSSPFA